jgi:hypothetical protein
MRRSVKDILARFDEVCRAIIQAGREPDPIAMKTLAPSVQPEIERFLGTSPGENAYATHVAHGMAKLRAQR